MRWKGDGDGDGKTILAIVCLTSSHSMGSGTKHLHQGWCLSYSGVPIEVCMESQAEGHALRDTRVAFMMLLYLRDEN